MNLIRTMSIGLTLGLAATLASAQASPPTSTPTPTPTGTAPPPVRLDAQGGCPADKPTGTLSIEKSPRLSGTVRSAHAYVPGLQAAHEANTQGEAPWLSKARGRSGPNRVYRTREGHVLVMTLCNPDDCAGNRAYMAWVIGGRQWGATVFEGRNLRELVAGAGQTTLAVHPSLIEKALVCASTLDMGTP
jgi:Inhibitor of vertebrate lysozyme (Ivy)